MSCAFHNTTMRIVPLKNSGDIIERSTIGSIKAFVDESERESARSVCGGIWLPWFFSSPTRARLRSHSNLMFISIWQRVLVWRQLPPGDEKEPWMLRDWLRVAAEQRSYRFHPARGLKRLYPRRHRPHISSLNVILIMMKLELTWFHDALWNSLQIRLCLVSHLFFMKPFNDSVAILRNTITSTVLNEWHLWQILFAP